MLESLERCRSARCAKSIALANWHPLSKRLQATPPPPHPHPTPAHTPRGNPCSFEKPGKGFLTPLGPAGYLWRSSLQSSPLWLASATPRGAQQLQQDPVAFVDLSGSGRTPQAALGRQPSLAFGRDGPDFWLAAYRYQRVNLARLWELSNGCCTLVWRGRSSA